MESLRGGCCVTREQLIALCVERALEARAQADDSARYAAWMRSPAGLAHEDEWLGSPESSDADAVSFSNEAAFFEALQHELESARDHRCGLPSSIVEALNSGDGTYRP